jgi:hypothetical protein
MRAQHGEEMMREFRASLIGFCAAVAARQSLAQSDYVAQFYTGRQITLIFGCNAGGGMLFYGRVEQL